MSIMLTSTADVNIAYTYKAKLRCCCSRSELVRTLLYLRESLYCVFSIALAADGRIFRLI